jgi:hypothetical protein
MSAAARLRPGRSNEPYSARLVSLVYSVDVPRWSEVYPYILPFSISLLFSSDSNKEKATITMSTIYLIVSLHVKWEG